MKTNQRTVKKSMKNINKNYNDKLKAQSKYNNQNYFKSNDKKVGN